jgi:O-antigen ligase
MALMQSHQFDHRINDIKSNLISWQKGDDNTSIGVRLAIWKIALEMYKENPIFGKGPGTFTQTVVNSYQNGHISKMVADQGSVQPHNEYLAAASQLGSIGLIADMAIFLIPMILFINLLRQKRNFYYAAFGLTITLLFMIFGASIEILLRVTFSSIYGLLIALIYAITHETAEIKR